MGVVWSGLGLLWELLVGVSTVLELVSQKVGVYASSIHMLGKPAQLYGVDWKGEELDHAHNLRQVQSWKDQFQR